MTSSFQRPSCPRPLRAGLSAVAICVWLAGSGYAQEGERRADDRAPALDRGQIARVVDEYLAVTRPAPQEKGWERVFDRLTLFGDLRLRHESSFELMGKPDRHRERMRLRIGGNYDLTDQVQIGARIITGDADDPNSPHSTFGDVFNSIDLSLDRAFATWRPLGVEGLWLTGGKFGHGFFKNPVYGELLWDGDVQPEGVLGGYSMGDVGPVRNVTFRAGEYLLLEQGGGSEASALVAQVDGSLTVSDSWSARAALAYYDYTDVTPDGSTAILGDNAGNATVDTDADGLPDDFASGFRLLNPILSFHYSGLDQPLALSAEYIENTQAVGDKDRGWALGAAWGEARKSGDVRLYYQLQVVEQDAVFSPFAQDDFLFATNHRSHLLGCNYQAADQIGLHLWALVSTPEDAGAGMDDEQWRIRLDLNIKF